MSPRPPEGPPIPERHARAGAAIRALHAAWCEGDTAGEDPGGLLQALRRWRRASGAPLRLELHGGDFFANGRYVPLDAWTLDRALELAERLARADVGLIEFPAQVDETTVRTLLDCLDARLRGTRVDCAGCNARVAAAAPGAHPDRPEPLAVFVPAIAEELRRLGAGERLMRPLVHLLLAAAQGARIQPETPPPGDSPAHAVLEAVTLATWLGQPPRDAVLAGLAVAVRSLAADAPPPRVALGFEGLGRLGEELVGVVAAAEPHPAGLLDGHADPRARVAGLVLAFQRLREGCATTDEALFALTRAWGEDGRAYAAWRGSRAAIAPDVTVEDDDLSVTASTDPTASDDAGWSVQPSDAGAEPTGDEPTASHPPGWVPRRFRR